LGLTSGLAYLSGRLKNLAVAWKNFTFAVGLGWLLWGATFWTEYIDWDFGLSLLMAGSTYLFADWSLRVVKQRRYAMWPLAALATWWCVDGSYWLYWSLVNPAVSIREGQWPASLCLFLLCGLIWNGDPRRLLSLKWCSLRAVGAWLSSTRREPLPPSKTSRSASASHLPESAP
jgi:hypothetical protein